MHPYLKGKRGRRIPQRQRMRDKKSVWEIKTMKHNNSQGRKK